MPPLPDDRLSGNESTRLRRRPVVALRPPSPAPFAIFCGAHELITSENIVESDYDEYRAGQVHILPEPLSNCSFSYEQTRRTTRSNGCGARVHGAVSSFLRRSQSSSASRDSNQTQSSILQCWYGAENEVASTVAPLERMYFSQSLVEVLDLRDEETGCGCVQNGVGCAVCGNPLGAVQTHCPTHASHNSTSTYIFAPSAVTPSPSSRAKVAASTFGYEPLPTWNVSPISDQFPSPSILPAGSISSTSGIRFPSSPPSGDGYTTFIPMPRSTSPNSGADGPFIPPPLRPSMFIPPPPGAVSMSARISTYGPPPFIPSSTSTAFVPPTTSTSTNTRFPMPTSTYMEATSAFYPSARASAYSYVPPTTTLEGGVPIPGPASASAPSPTLRTATTSTTTPRPPRPMRRRTLRRPGSVERYLSAEGSASSSPASLSSSHSSLPLPSIGVGAGANASVSYDASAGGGWGQVLPPLQRERDVDTEDWPRFTNAWGEELRANANASFQADLQRQMALRAGLGREREVPPVWGVRARVGDASDSDSAPVPVDADGWEPYEFQWDDAVRWVAAQGGDSLTQSEGVAGTRAQAQEDGGTRRDAQVQGGDDTPVVRHRYVDDDTLVRGDVYLPRASSPSTRSPTATPSASTSSSALPFTPPSAPDDADAGTTLARMRSLSRHLGALGARAAALDVAAENVRRHIEALGVPVPARPAFLGTAGGTPSAGVGTNMQAGQGRAEAREAAFAALLRATTNAPSSSVAPSLSTSSPAPGPTAPVDADADARRTALLARVGGLIATADAGAREAGAVLARARETRARLETQGVRTARAREILEGVHMRGEGEQEGRTPATGTAAGTGMDSGIEPLRRSMIAAQAALERVRTARRARVEGYAEIEATALASRPPPSGSRRVDEEKRPDPPPRRRTFFDR